MTTKTLSLRLPLGLYEQLEREAMERKIAVTEVIIECVKGFHALRAAARHPTTGGSTR